MATRVGAHSPRLTAVRALRSAKGRREQQRFAFEGATLLQEAVAARFPIAEIYATQAAFDATPALRELDGLETRVFIAGEAAFASLSDVATPSGIVAVAPVALRPAAAVMQATAPFLVLADLNDPANAGTLLRSADAFGAGGVIFGRLAVDPYHPKVVRGSMGAIFRVPMGVGDPQEVQDGAVAAGIRLLGLAAGGTPLADAELGGPIALVVGNERHGLGAWQRVCQEVIAIPMRGRAESLSAAVAGSIALYLASGL